MTRAAIPHYSDSELMTNYLQGQETAHQASYSSHYGSGSPPTTYPCQEYADSATHLMMRMNEGNTAAYVIDSLDSSRVLNKTSNYTVAVNDIGKTILCDCSSGNLTITLPPASNAGSNFSLIIKRIDDSANKVIVDAYSSQLIDGQLSFNLLCSDEYLSLRCDGTSWYVVGRKTPNPNLLINGGLEYWPENPNVNIVGVGAAYIAGIFKLFNNLSTATLGHIRSIPSYGSGELPDEVSFFSTIDPTGTLTPGQTWGVVQYTDDIVQWSGKTITYSIWMDFGKSASSILNVNAILQYDTITPSSLSVESDYVNVVSGWKKYTFTLTLPTLSGKTLAGTPYIQIGFNVKSEYNDTVSFTLIKAEFADKATRWVPKSRSQEIFDMAYYFHTTYMIEYYVGDSGDQKGRIFGHTGYPETDTTVEIYINYQFPRKMRIRPNLITYSEDGQINKITRHNLHTNYNVVGSNLSEDCLFFIFSSGLSSNWLMGVNCVFDARF